MKTLKMNDVKFPTNYGKKSDRLAQEKMLDNFLQTLKNHGESYFSHGSTKSDFDYILGILNFQGFYSGIYNRYYFNDNFDLIKVERK